MKSLLTIIRVKGGLLSPLGDPLGKALNTGLSPLGSVVGGVTSPLAEGASKVTKPAVGALGLGGQKKEDESKGPGGESIGGKEQTGNNPLGL
jgi:hypothetical protein